ncbi:MULTISPECIES: hypothetical protein [Bacillus cereus group]|uniref:hypothetical protein n=1 Tax=Bacillus cereus group TaxID=86661 RepID=UPI0001A1DBAA|nr:MULTISPECIES: hypothetical protein [Bacillus cereus group]EEM56184.1 hypothetical protein bthur0007_59850 [Bacillus thuringiensis serovar monterrey BGSC 4AJ1]MEB9674120.1 hypothetical protein [Bacillus anthracis]
MTTNNNERTVSKRKEKRVKKALQTFAIQTIDDLFKKFYHTKVGEGVVYNFCL